MPTADHIARTTLGDSGAYVGGVALGGIQHEGLWESVQLFAEGRSIDWGVRLQVVPEA